MIMIKEKKKVERKEVKVGDARERSERRETFTWKLEDDPIQMEKLLLIQERLISRTTDLVERHEKLIESSNSNLSMMEYVEVTNAQTVIRNLPTKDYGRMMGTLADEYAQEFIEANTPIKFIDEERDGNQAGHDKLTVNDTKLQIKFRQYSGKTPYSTGTYLETTRRRSEKNKGPASRNGHVTYGADEFHGLFLILAPADKNKRSTKYWTYCCIPAAELVDEENPEFMATKVTAATLQRNSDWKNKLMIIDGAK